MSRPRTIPKSQKSQFDKLTPRQQARKRQKMGMSWKVRGRGKRIQPDMRPPEVVAGYAFIVLVGTAPNAEWHYVTFDYCTTLDVSRSCWKVFPTITPEMGEFWRRVTIDNAYCWDSAFVDPKTLRLVEIRRQSHDVTDKLFYDEDEAQQQRKLAALSKLTPEDAKVLGVDTDYVILKIFQNTKAEERDEIRADKFREQLRELEIGNFTA